LICLNDRIAMGCYQAIADCGLRIPDDVSVVSFDGSDLAGWLLKDMRGCGGWQVGPALMFAGFALVWFVDRFITPVCPACSHTHDHDVCSTRLHGFAGPLITAALIHSLFDGWTLAAGQSIHGSGAALAASVIVHKIPESIAYGVILKAALKSRTLALGWALTAQAATIAGAVLGIAFSARLGEQWMGALLALGGGTFLYLGFHAVHGEWRRRAALRVS